MSKMIRKGPGNQNVSGREGVQFIKTFTYEEKEKCRTTKGVYFV